MLAFWIKALISGIIVAAVATIARRHPAAGALVASLPLISILGMVWLWHDAHDAPNLARHAEATFFYVIPSLPMFLATPAMLRYGVGFWPTLATGCALTILLYLVTVFVAARFGVRL